LTKHTKVIILAIFVGTCSVSWANENGSSVQDQLLDVKNSLIEGASGVSTHLEYDEDAYDDKPDMNPFPSLTDWKKQLKKEHGLSFGAYAIMLYQYAQKILPENEHDSAGTVLWFHGDWTAYEREDGHFGRIQWRVEKRSAIAGLQAPSDLKNAIGLAVPNTAVGYVENFNTDISVLNWSHGYKNRASIAVGRLAFDAYLDSFFIQTFFRTFLNGAIALNPTLATTGVGALGVVAKGFVTDNILIGVHIYDANAVSGEFDMDTFKHHEWLTAFEIAWTPSIASYKIDRVQFTYWHKDERQEAGVEEGQGWAVSASHQLTDNLIPFIRFGHSDGGAGVAAESSASVGFEYTPREYHAWSLAAGWAKPSEKTHGADLSDEYTFETSYKFQLSRHFSIMPDAQLMLNPAKNPNVDSSWVLGLRLLLTL
jgi:porin